MTSPLPTRGTDEQRPVRLKNGGNCVRLCLQGQGKVSEQWARICVARKADCGAFHSVRGGVVGGHRPYPSLYLWRASIRDMSPNGHRNRDRQRGRRYECSISAQHRNLPRWMVPAAAGAGPVAKQSTSRKIPAYSPNRWTQCARKVAIAFRGQPDIGRLVDWFGDGGSVQSHECWSQAERGAQ